MAISNINIMYGSLNKLFTTLVQASFKIIHFQLDFFHINMYALGTKFTLPYQNLIRWIHLFTFLNTLIWLGVTQFEHFMKVISVSNISEKLEVHNYDRCKVISIYVCTSAVPTAPQPTPDFKWVRSRESGHKGWLEKKTFLSIS